MSSEQRFDPVGWPKVQEKELETIDVLRQRRGVRDEQAGKQQKPHDARLVDLAFSGGGIRSATFNLGVLQGLAKLGLLRHFDYLSTVSGGGYIGSWLVARIKRHGLKDADAVLRGGPPAKEAELSGDEVECPDAVDSRIEPIRFLRRYSNYLTPRKGFFSLDTWMAASAYVHNLLPNLTILVLFLALVLTLPRLWLSIVFHMAGDLAELSSLWWFAAAFLLALPATRIMARALGGIGSKQPSQIQMLLLYVILFLLATVLGLWFFAIDRTALNAECWMAIVAFELVLVFSMIVCWSKWSVFLQSRSESEDSADQDRQEDPHSRRLDLRWLKAVFAGALTGWLLALVPADIRLGKGAPGSAEQIETNTMVAVWAAPGMLFFLLLTLVYLLAIAARSEKERQWWSRLVGALGIAALVLLAWSCVTFYATRAPPSIQTAGTTRRRRWLSS